MPSKKENPIPEFASPEQERAYWDKVIATTKGKWQRSPARKDGEKLSSFLNIRMSGQEITDLQRAARKHGLNISTYVRLILLAEVKRTDGGSLSLPGSKPSSASQPNLAIAEVGNGLYVIDKRKVKDRQKLVETLDKLLKPS